MRSSKIAVELIVLAMAITMSGCATIVSGTNQKVSVTSQPSGAKVTADGKTSSITPTDFTLERKSDHTLEFSKDGYKTATVMLKRTMNGMGFGNVLVGGVIGVGVDAVSGAGNKLVPERVDLVLEEGSGYSSTPKFANAKDAEFYEKSILGSSKQKSTNSQPVQATATAKTDTKNNFAANNFAAKKPAV